MPLPTTSPFTRRISFAIHHSQHRVSYSFFSWKHLFSIFVAQTNTMKHKLFVLRKIEIPTLSSKVFSFCVAFAPSSSSFPDPLHTHKPTRTHIDQLKYIKLYISTQRKQHISQLTFINSHISTHTSQLTIMKSHIPTHTHQLTNHL